MRKLNWGRLMPRIVHDSAGRRFSLQSRHGGISHQQLHSHPLLSSLFRWTMRKIPLREWIWAALVLALIGYYGVYFVGR